MKIYWNLTLAWAVDYGDVGNCMTLSADSSFLIADSAFSTNGYLGKLRSSDGVVLESYSSS